MVTNNTIKFILLIILLNVNLNSYAQKVTIFVGHGDRVTSVTWSPDSRFIASSSDDNEIKIWDVSSKSLIRVLKPLNIYNSSHIKTVEWSPDGKYIAGGTTNYDIIIWLVDNGLIVNTIKSRSSNPDFISWSPDSKYILGDGGSNTAIIWKALKKSKGLSLKHARFINSGTWSPDGNYIAIGSELSITIWDVSKKSVKLDFRGHERFSYEGFIEAISWSPNGNYIVSASRDGLIIVWEASTGEIIHIMKNDMVIGLNSVSWSPGAEYIICSAVSGIFIWRAENGEFLKTYEQKIGIETVSWSPDGRYTAFPMYMHNVAVKREDLIIPINMGKKLISTKDLFHISSGAPSNLSASVLFIEPSGNGALDAEEEAKFEVTIKNQGPGKAGKINIQLSSSGVIGLNYDLSDDVKGIDVGKSVTVVFNLKANTNLQSTVVDFNLSFSEEYGFEPDPIYLSIETKKLKLSNLRVVDYGVDDSNGNGKVEPLEIFTLTIRIQNRGQGDARNVIAEVMPGNNVFFHAESRKEHILGNISPGAYKDISYTLYTNKRVEKKIPIKLKLTEDRSQFSIEESIDLVLNKQDHSLAVLEFKSSEVMNEIINVPGISIDIEENIPKTKMKNSDGIAIIIGNRNYQIVKNVDYALRDAQFMKEYLIKSLGYKEGNILLIQDATKGEFETLFGSKGNHKGRLYNMVKRGKSDVFIYYSGHGAPGVNEKKGYFVPVESDPGYIEIAGYGLETLYTNLSKVRARSITVVLDACFSGAGLLENVSPLTLGIKDHANLIGKNGLILSSTSGDQLASWYPEKKHGLFTYYFLEGIQSRNADQNADGTITFGEMRDYLSDPTEGIPYYARRLHNIEQTPSLYGDKDRVLVKF